MGAIVMTPQTAFAADDVRRVRIERGLTQEELARELGVSFSTVNAWECGRSRPQRRHRQRLADFTAEYPQSVVSTRMSIMCVDDSPVDLEIATVLVRDALAVLGVDADVTGESDPLWALIQLGERQPAVAFIDVMMPGLDGFEVAARLDRSESLRSTVVALVTASTDPVHRDRARAAGLPLLAKPLTPAAVGRVLRAIPALRVN